MILQFYCITFLLLPMHCLIDGLGFSPPPPIFFFLIYCHLFFFFFFWFRFFTMLYLQVCKSGEGKAVSLKLNIRE